MHSKITALGIKSMIWWFNKNMRNSMKGLNVETNSMKPVRQLLSDGHRVVLMPIYKSMADAFIYIYIHNHFNLEAPFIFGN